MTSRQILLVFWMTGYHEIHEHLKHSMQRNYMYVTVRISNRLGHYGTESAYVYYQHVICKIGDCLYYCLDK